MREPPRGRPQPEGRSAPISIDAQTDPVHAQTRYFLGSRGIVQVCVRDQAEDRHWDAFVAEHPLGFPTQSTAYARTRAKNGFRSLRVCLEQAGKIVAGAQLQWRSIRGLGRLGSLVQGPVVDPKDEGLVRPLLDAVDATARKIRISRLRVSSYTAQPALNGSLEALGFQPSEYSWDERQTCVVDLKPPENEILATMHKKTRYNIRLADRKGVQIEEGTAGDITEFHRLLASTAARQGFPVHPLEYFQEIYPLFAPQKMGLILAKFEAQPLAASLVCLAGGRAMDAWGGFTEEHRSLKPNEAVIWGAIRWAKAKGCEAYDLMGVSTDPTDSVGAFKNRFGRVQERPESYDKYYGLLAPARRRLFQQAWARPRLQRVVRSVQYRFFDQLAH